MNFPLRRIIALPVLAALALVFPLAHHLPSASSQPTARLTAAVTITGPVKRPVLTKTQNAAIQKWIREVKHQQTIAALTYWNQIFVNACGGDLPSCCTVRYESNWNIYAVNPGHSGAPYGDPGNPWVHASGKWQFMPSTWNRFMGYPYAAAAPAKVQNEKAREVYAGGAGASNWYGDGCYNGR